MIDPRTRLFGLLMSDPRIEGHVTRLYNCLMGVNGHNAAYLSFVVKPEHLTVTLEGFVRTAKTECVHVAPVHQQATGRWLRQAPVDRVTFSAGQATGHDVSPGLDWLDADAVVARARADLLEWFGSPPEVPADWRGVLTETSFRPCKLTHDDFKELHAARRST